MSWLPYGVINYDIAEIDRTFNLGPCFVTTLLYKNKAALRRTTSDYLVFLGPVLFQFDAKADTYTSFLRIYRQWRIQGERWRRPPLLAQNFFPKSLFFGVKGIQSVVCLCDK